jgi:molecular chaperone DnaJ
MSQLLLLVLISAFQIIHAASSSSSSKFLVQAKDTCQRQVCLQADVGEKVNCVSKCLSPTCFHRVYASAPLEDGEIDEKRRTGFNACLAAEERADRSKKKSAAWSGQDNVSEEEKVQRDSEWL